MHPIGSTHDVRISDELDEGFQSLAEERHGGGMVSITEQKTESFNFEEIKKHTDKEEENDEQLIQL